jgi:hypothetical protein
LHRLALIGHPVRVPTTDPFPRRSTRGARLLTAGAVLLAAAAGCSDIADGSPGVQRTDLVTDLATQLEASTALTYSAEYQLSGGATARITQAQAPLRSAYVYPHGMVVVTADATTECRTGAKELTCTLTAPPAPVDRPPATLFAEAGRGGMVAPPIVLGLLNAAALDTDAVIEQHDTTIAGRHATCVAVANVDGAAASAFDACVTTEGVLGSFTGIVDGAAIDVAMTRYQETVDGRVFDPPATAKVIDRR